MKKEPTYEYQWVAITDKDVLFLTDFYKTGKAVRKAYSPTVTILSRLNESKREVINYLHPASTASSSPV